MDEYIPDALCPKCNTRSRVAKHVPFSAGTNSAMYAWSYPATVEHMFVTCSHCGFAEKMRPADLSAEDAAQEQVRLTDILLNRQWKD